MTHQHTECAALNCTRKGEHLNTCHIPTCNGCWPKPATHGHLCQHHYDRINTALQIAHRLTTALAEVERAVKTDPDRNSVTGPRLPLTAWRVDLDRINRALEDKTTEDAHTGQRVLLRPGYRGDLDVWISTFQGALDALDFARYVRIAERNHPLEERVSELRIVRCGGCLRRTVILRPPDWYTGHRTLECTECGWKTTDEDHAEAGTYVEALVRNPYPRPKITIPDYPIDLGQLQTLVNALR